MKSIIIKVFYSLLISLVIFFSGCGYKLRDNQQGLNGQTISLSFDPNEINLNFIEELKLKFENLKHDNVIALYYLSEISRLQNKFQEAYSFISQAYELSHADSIYQQKEKIKALIPVQELLIEDSYSKDILWINDNMLAFKTNEKYVTSQRNNTANKEQTKINNDSTIEQLVQTGRADVQKLYNSKQYLSAINNTKMLIQLIEDLKEEKYIKKELSQLYQDLAVLYAKENNIIEANSAIDRAIELNQLTQTFFISS